LGLPVLMGPSVTNFERVDALLAEADARIRVHNAEDLAAHLISLFADETARLAMGERARQVVEAHRGACAETFQLLAEQVVDSGEIRG